MKSRMERIDLISFSIKISNPDNPAIKLNGMKLGELDYFQQLEVHKGIGINNNQYLCMKKNVW